MTKSNFLFFYYCFWFWVRITVGWFISRFLSYILVSEYPLSEVLGVMYLLILVAIDPSILNDLVLMGCSDEDLLDMPKFKVEPSKVLALNLLLPGFYSVTLSSNLFPVDPNILFLYSYKISFLWFFSFLVLFNSGSSNPFFVAHFFSRPCSLLI